MLRTNRWLKGLVFLLTLGICVNFLYPGLSAKASTQTLSFIPTADAFVYQSNPTTNYGTSTSLRVDNSPVLRSYIRFAVSGVNGNAVTSASLKIYANSSLSTGFAVNAVSDNTWTESGVVYNNAPTPGNQIGTSGTVNTGQWVTIDISPYITGDGTYNLALTPLSSTQLNLAARESGANAPQLVVNISSSTAPTPTPTAVSAPTATPTSIARATATPTPINNPTATALPATATPTSVAGIGQVPVFSHVIVLIFENKEYGSIIGNSSLPNFNNLANQYTLLTKSYAVGHPSLPNYIALTSGSTQGITSDCTSCFLKVANIADSIEASGRNWKGYMESMPSTCYIGNSGLYVQKHNPFIYYDDIRTNAARCNSHVVPMTQLDTDLKNNTLPDFAWITPNECNNSHDCSSTVADSFLGAQVNKILSSPAFDKNSLLIVTFDEGSSSATCCGLSGGGGHIATILISPLVKSGYQDTTPVTHYSLLKTIEKSWGMPYILHAGDLETNLITAAWK